MTSLKNKRFAMEAQMINNGFRKAHTVKFELTCNEAQIENEVIDFCAKANKNAKLISYKTICRLDGTNWNRDAKTLAEADLYGKYKNTLN